MLKQVQHDIFNLHLDQRHSRYEGIAAHSGEYDGKVVEEESARIAKSVGLV